MSTGILNSFGIDLKQELDLIFAYYDKIREEYKNDKYLNTKVYELDEGKNPNTWIDKLYYFICDLRGFSAFPKVLSDEEFSNFDILGTGNAYLYHGFEEFEHGAKYLWDYYYHYGEGTYGSGFYLSDDPHEALSYTRNNVSADKNRILKVHVSSKNGILAPELEWLARDLSENKKGAYEPMVKSDDAFDTIEEKQAFERKEKQRQEMFDLLCDYIHTRYTGEELDFLTLGIETNLSILGAYLGFDFTERLEYNKNHLIMLNRGAVETSESEFRRFMDCAGEKYEGLSYEK